jgi:hypothetical protein
MSVLAETSGASVENVTTEELLTTAQTMDKDKGALFVSLYDGKTDVEAYSNHFNTVVAKAENGFGIDDLLVHHGNVLSGKQIGKIFSEVRIKADHMQRAKFQKLSEETAKEYFEKAHFKYYSGVGGKLLLVYYPERHTSQTFILP